jgi:organic radical activating enzyme
MLIKPTLPFLETMITQACNISCTGCTNYSDLKHDGYVTWAQGQEELSAWLERVDIPDFGIMGGEPLLNPECKQWIQGVRDLMPSSQIRFTTNGLLLTEDLRTIDTLYDVGNCVIKITVHVDDPRLETVIDSVRKRYAWTPVREFGIDRWTAGNNVRFQINRPRAFYKTFIGSYADMRPHASDPVAAFDMCIQQTCPLLYQGKIYKCSSSGLLDGVLSRRQYPNRAQWEKYLIKGLSVTDSNQALDSFIDNFGKPNAVCAMCPSKQDTESILDHYQYVKFKK